MVPALPNQLLQDPAPLFDRLRDVLLAVALASKNDNRFANNNLVAAITRSGDEERIDGHLRDLGENEGAIGQADLPAKKMRRRCRQVSIHAVPLNGNDLAETECVQKIEGEQGACSVVINFNRAFATFFERGPEMLRSLPVWLRSTDEADFPMKFLGKQSGA